MNQPNLSQAEVSSHVAKLLVFYRGCLSELYQSFDALVDLNQSFNQCLSLLSLQLKIPIKIGFQSPIADDLYSVVIQPLENSFLEGSYQVVEMILGMRSE